jgi:GGDEF domain-containing protein
MSSPSPTVFEQIEFHSELLNHSPLAILICDKNDRVVNANQLFYQLTQLDNAQVVNQLFLSLPLEIVDSEAKIMQLFANEDGNEVKFQYWQEILTLSDSTENYKVYYLVQLDSHLALAPKSTSIKSSKLKHLKVPKRVSWVEFLDYEVSRSRRYDNPLSLAKLHLLIFEQEDTALQDKLRQQVKDTLMDELRWADMIGDTAQGSFLLVLPETDQAAVSSLQKKLSQAIKHKFKQEQQELQYELVFAHVSWQKNDDSQRLLQRARDQLVTQLEKILAQH